MGGEHPVEHCGLRWLERRKAPDNQWMVHPGPRWHGAKRPCQRCGCAAGNAVGLLLPQEP